MANKNLTNAKKAKNDEFYTQFSDIQKEIGSYLEYDPNTFKNKVVYCNCDDPFESNFFRYFVLNFNRLGLKSLITTSYKPSPVANTQLGLFGDDKTLEKSKGRPKVTANKFIINEVGDVDGDGSFTLEDIAKQLKANKNNEWAPLESDGDFRSNECVELLKESDIVVTNPPFSLFREYVKQLIDNNKKFIIIGNMNALKYTNIFPLIQNNNIWLGVSNGAKTYIKPDKTEQKMGNTCWFTNIDHGRRHQWLPLMTLEDNLRYSKHKEINGKKSYDTYDNYDAIEVPFTDAIPSDYSGCMGVPISFLDKYNPDQFEIIDMLNRYTLLDAQGTNEDVRKRRSHTCNIKGKPVFSRIVIRHKKK